VQLLLDEAAHLQHLVANLLQVFVEAPGDVVGEIGRFHGDTFMNTRDRLQAIEPHVNSVRHKCDVPHRRSGADCRP
jgi:hypothetical protein